MTRTKIFTGYYQSGYGKGLARKAIVYLINGKAYARHKAGWEHTNPSEQLTGELEGYVAVNPMIIGGKLSSFHAVGATEQHVEFINIYSTAKP